MRSDHLHPSLKFPGRFYSPTITTNALRLLWILLICWGELGVYYWSLSTCRWPVHKTAGEALRALLISDTQIYAPSLPPDPTPLLPNPHAFFTKKYLKKSWHVASQLKPHAVIFLGDMLRNGKSVKNGAQFDRLAQEFKTTFPLGVSSVAYYLPGNNDVGMGLLTPPTKDIRKYYQKHFGPLNGVFTLNNHTFLALDAPGLVDEDYQRNARGVSFDHWEPIPGGAVEAVRSLAAQHHHPVILLSHIPLYRPDSASCGPLRERGTIVRGVGRGYQNTLGKKTTAFLMKILEPVAVFSGDNRDYCEYVHKGTSFDVPGSITETTVKSFSPSSQIRRPGFQLVSIIDPINLAPDPQPQSLLNRPCLLPDQTLTFTGYIWWTFVTFCVIFVLNVQRIRKFRLTKPLDASLNPSPTSSDHTSPSFPDTNDTLSSVWSPHAPFQHIPPRSPRLQMPSSFRMPVAPATPTFRASSRPMTPQGSNDLLMLSPQLIPSVHDDEDSMFPDQYTIRRDVHHLADEEWTLMGRGEYYDSGSQYTSGTLSGGDGSTEFSSPSQFIPASGGMHAHYKGRRTWTILWSKTFMLGGKRRRILLSVPRLSAWWSESLEFLEILRDVDRRTFLKRRGIFISTLLESISVFWPAGVVWLVINCWIF